MKNQIVEIPGRAIGLPMLQHVSHVQSFCAVRNIWRGKVSRPSPLDRLARGYRGRVGGLAATGRTAMLRRII